MTKRILLVDDERSIRESLSKILGAENYEVVLAANGQDAIEKNCAERIDLLILDLNMPVKNGWDALEWLIEIKPRLPVVIITGRSDQRALAETAGAAALMEKPLDVPLLLQIIRELVAEPREMPGTKMACQRSQVTSHLPLANEEPRLPHAQPIAPQHNEDCTPLA